MRKLAPALFVLATTSACVNEYDIDVNVNQANARHTFNQAKHMCMLPGATNACKMLGDDALQTTSFTKAGTYWSEPRDPYLAHMAYGRGCANGDGQSCAALLEYHLTTGPVEDAWAKRRVAFLYARVRSTEEVKRAQHEAQDTAGDLDAAHQQRLDEEAQRDAEKNARAWNAVGEGIQNAPSQMQLGQNNVTTRPVVVQSPPRNTHPTAQQLRQDQLERDAAFQKQQQQNQQQQTNAQNNAALAEQQRKANLAKCLATDLSCPNGSYGTSSNCVPSVAYTDRFGMRGVIRTVHMDAQMYSGSDMGAQWNAEMRDQINPLLVQANIPSMVQIMNQFQSRKSALSSAVLVGYPSCGAPDASTEQLGFWCANRRADCLTHSDSSVQELECARQQDQFLYYAEAKQRGIDIQQSHDASCHQQFGY